MRENSVIFLTVPLDLSFDGVVAAVETIED